ncbi:MAG: O-antigen ligase family protein [bacterium]|nr:O-antigen ligase family protein [bacterium]MDZ4296529.1 O-antigen ligase family protein [Patescibacteria group bacterium]
MRFTEWTSGFLYVSDLLLFGVVLLWFLQRPAIRWTLPDKLLGVFLGVALMSALFAEERFMSFYQVLRLFECALLFGYVEHNISRFSLRSIGAVLVAAGFFQGALAIGQFTLQHDLGLYHIEPGPLGAWIRGVANFFTADGKFIRAYGTFPHPNVLAVFLLTAIGAVFSLQMSHEGVESNKRNARVQIHANTANSVIRSRYLRFVFFALFFLILAFLLTFSRAVILAGIAGLLALLFWAAMQERWRQKGVMAVGVFLVILVTLGVLLWPELKSRFHFSRHEEAVEYRIVSSESAWEVIKKHPAFGVGAGNFVAHIRRASFDTPKTFLADGIQPVHNVWLLIASEMGLVGLFSYAAFLCALLYGFYRRQRNYRWAFVIVLAALGALTLVDHYFWTLQQGRLIWWVGWGVAAGLAIENQPVGGAGTPRQDRGGSVPRK